MSDQVPYQAYKSKRHSHNPSNSHLSQHIAPPNSTPHHVTAPASQITPLDYQISIPVETSTSSTLANSDSDTAPTASPESLSFAGPSQSSLQSDKVKPAVNPSTKRASTFRRVPRSTTHLSHTPSPLGPNHKSTTHPSVSLSSGAQGTPSPENVITRVPSPSIKPQTSPTSTPPLGVADFIEPSSSLFITAGSSSKERQSSVVSLPSSSQPALQQIKPANVGSNTVSSTGTANGSQSPKSVVRYAQAPYRPGFQPKGVIRPLTDDFLALRHANRDGGSVDVRGTRMKRAERTKLTRRLEKLIALHFSHLTADYSPNGRDKQRPGLRVSGSGTHRRASSLFDFDIKNVNLSDPGALIRGIIGSGEVNNIRAAEQRITPWQDDADVTKCPLCSTSFHPLTNRKHHCRLCGQIICSLPVKGPHRLSPCSLLFIVDPKTQRIEEVNESVDYGVRKRAGNGAPNPVKEANIEEDKFLKGVRICWICRPILLRQQYQRDIVCVPTILNLYETFIKLEKEIEESLPQFQELTLSLSRNDQPAKEAVAARKRLVEAFTEYDRVSKQIWKLPCASGSGGSQERVQIAIMGRANMFLQRNMFPLQSLPVPRKMTSQSSKISPHTNGSSYHIDTDSKTALALQPLLEQEALLETFVEEAKAHRKFEDAKTLKANLEEIRTEIERIITNGENGLLKE